MVFFITLFGFRTAGRPLWGRLTLFFKEDDDLKNKINEIVPLSSIVNPVQLHIYELKDGNVMSLNSYEGLPSDENFLNIQLGETNELFDQLLEIEEEFDNKN